LQLSIELFLIVTDDGAKADRGLDHLAADSFFDLALGRYFEVGSSNTP
jgi:hypothetical protein